MMPWYKSAILRGILVTIVAQLFARVAAQYHIDFAAAGITADSAVAWLLDGVSALALAYSAHARVTKPLPPITSQQVKP